MSQRNKPDTLLLPDSALVRPVEAGPRRAVLVLIYAPGSQVGRHFELHEGEHIVSRLQDQDIWLDNESISRRHARFVPEQESQNWAVEDLGSMNGTYVNDERITRRVLVDGDQVRFGSVIVKYITGDNIEGAYHEEIYRMSILDGLTSCHNKRYLLDFLDREIASAGRYKLPLCVVMADIDHFKKVNDEWSHLAGDAVLKDVSSRLRARMRRDDLVSRYGGEEFCFVLTNTALDGGFVFAESVRRLIENTPCQYGDAVIPVTMSFGIGELNESDRSPGDILRRADENLYIAKRTGRNKVVS